MKNVHLVYSDMGPSILNVLKIQEKAFLGFKYQYKYSDPELYLPPLLNFCPPCNIKPAQQISFVVKYLSENAPEVISESLKLKFSWRSMPHTT